MQTILTIAGTRPEAIKLAPVILELRKRPDDFRALVCSTGQHREMLTQSFASFGIAPDIELDVMEPGQSLAGVTARLFGAIDEVLELEQPDWVLIQGDTVTVLVASLCCYFRRINIGHIEAGLRSGDIWAPFPEEVNRRVTTLVTQLHFAPTDAAADNLRTEGVAEESIRVTGNTVIDSLLWTAEKARVEPPELPAEVEAAVRDDRKMVLITGHRRENFGQGMENVCQAIAELASAYPNVLFFYPVHLNPQVQGPVNRILGSLNNVALSAPLPYVEFVRVMDLSHLILTDSGGIQEEAPSLSKPVLVTRDVTERPEGISAGTSKLVGTDRARIVEEVSRLLDDRNAYEGMAFAPSVYGDGQAAKRIVEALVS